MLNELIERICSDTGMSREEIMDKIEEKKIELSGLISDEGAAYIVAKELNVKLRKIEKIKIENIMSGMQNVDIAGKITRLTPVREYGTEKKGRVMNVFISDGTGTIRLPLWNDEIEKISDFHEGDVIHFRGYAIEGLSGPELRLGKFGSISKSDEIIETVKITRKTERASIGELGEGNYREVRAPIVQLFESNVFYEVCPECKTRLKFDEKDNELKCEHHGIVEPEYNMIVSGIIDDGTGHIRAVLFNENAEKLIGLSRKDAKKLFDHKKKMSAILERIPMGIDFIFEGRAKKNDFFDRLEFMVNTVRPIDVKEEIELMMKNE